MIKDNLKRIRKEKGLTQKELATKSGLSFSMVSKLESGEQINPSNETIQKLASALDVITAELLVDKNELLEKWNIELNNDQLSKELKLIELLKDLYPNDFNFIIDLFTRLGLLKSESGNDDTI